VEVVPEVAEAGGRAGLGLAGCTVGQADDGEDGLLCRGGVAAGKGGQFSWERPREIWPENVGGGRNGGAAKEFGDVEDAGHGEAHGQGVEGDVGVLLDFQDGARRWRVRIIVVGWDGVEGVVLSQASRIVAPFEVQRHFHVVRNRVR